MNSKFLTLLTVTSFALPTVAQTTLTLPPEYERAWGRGSSSALGGNSTRTQLFFAQPFAAGTVLTGFGLRPTASTVDRPAFDADIEVRVSSTTAVPGALSGTFASNVGTDEVVVLPRQIVTIPAMPANRGTGAFAVIPFTTPFIFGTNGATTLCIDLLVYSRTTGASWSTDRAFATASGRAVTAGQGCDTGTVSSTSTGGTYVAGSTISVTLANATPTSLALLIPSFDMKEIAPGLPLPHPLSLYGAGAGCDLLVAPTLGTLAFVTDGSGAASSSFTVPAGFGQLGTGWQWIYAVPPSGTNTLGFVTTANRAIWIGPEVVVPAAQYVYHLSNVSSATANAANVDSVPVTLLLTQ